MKIIQHFQNGNECFYTTIPSFLSIKATYSLLYISISLKTLLVQNFKNALGAINTYKHVYAKATNTLVTHLEVHCNYLMF